jgi:hypothetical protein
MTERLRGSSIFLCFLIPPTDHPEDIKHHVVQLTANIAEAKYENTFTTTKSAQM